MTDSHNACSAASDGGPIQNTDRHLWPQVSDEADAPSLFVTGNGEGIGINVGGHVFVKPLREWHALAVQSRAPAQSVGMSREKLAHTIAKHIACEEDCQKWPNGCGCALNAADAILASQPSPAATVEKIGRVDREGGWNAGRDIAHERSSAGNAGAEEAIRDWWYSDRREPMTSKEAAKSLIWYLAKCGLKIIRDEPQTSGVWLPIETAPEDLQEYAAKRSRNIPRGDVVQLGGSLADGTLFLFGHDALTHKAKQWMKIPPLQSPSPLSSNTRETGLVDK